MVKQNVKKKKRVSSGANRSSQFFVEMDARGVLIFLTLALLTAAVVFYLGFTFGKATRNPNDPSQQRRSISDSKSSSQQKLSKKDLNIYNIKEDKKRAAILKKDANSAIAEVDKLVKESKSTDTATRKSPPPAPKKVEPAPQAAVKPPVTSSAKTSKLWTFQIFATKDENKAGEFVKFLRQGGFDAYTAIMVSDGKRMYRVRVGRQSRSDMLKLGPKLEKVVAGLGVKPKLLPAD